MDFTNLALRFSGRATTSSMPDQPVTEHRPLFLWNKFLEIPFNFFRSRCFGEAQSIGKSLYVGVDNDPFVDAECIAEHDIGGLSTDTSQFDKG